MTNGEKIQHDFKCEVCDPIIEDNIIHVIFADKSDSAIGFDWDWWNLDYKESTTKNDLEVKCIVDVLGSYTDLDIPYKREIAENILTKLSSVTPQEPRWIPISKRLPKKYSFVLVSTDANEVFIADYLGKMSDGTDCFDDDDGMMWEGDIIAWMPMPEPYIEVEE